MFYKNHKFIYWLLRINSKKIDKLHNITRLSRDTGNMMKKYFKKKYGQVHHLNFYEIGKSDLWKTNI